MLLPLAHLSFAVLDPPSSLELHLLCGHPSGCHRGQRPDDRRLLSVRLCFYAKDAEAAVLVVKGDALDDTGDFLGERHALRDRGDHVWGFILTWRAGAWVTLTSQISGCLARMDRIVEVYGQT
jgi:hypothetical protein